MFWTGGGDTNAFPNIIELHQGFVLPLYCCDRWTYKRHPLHMPWYMIFVDDIVLLDETRKRANNKLELWKNTLESKGFKLSSSKQNMWMSV